MHYVFDYPPHLSFIFSSIRIPFCSAIPHWVSSCGLFIVPHICPHECFCYVQVDCVVSVWPTVIPVIVFFSVMSVGHCCFCLLLCAYDWNLLLYPFTLMSRVAAATFRLDNSACKDRIWYSCCPNWVDRLPFVFVISLKAASRAAVADAKFMKASSILSCLTLLALPGRMFELFPVKLGLLKIRLEPHPGAIICCDTLPHVIPMHVFLRHNIFFNTHVCEIPIGKWWVPRYCKMFSRLYLVKQDLYGVLNFVSCLHLLLILHKVSGHDLSVPHAHPVHQLHKGIICITYHHVFFPLDTIFANSCNGNFLEGAVHVLY